MKTRSLRNYFTACQARPELIPTLADMARHARRELQRKDAAEQRKAAISAGLIAPKQRDKWADLHESFMHGRINRALECVARLVIIATALYLIQALVSAWFRGAF